MAPPVVCRHREQKLILAPLDFQLQRAGGYAQGIRRRLKAHPFNEFKKFSRFFLSHTP
jgi:hypothetical protein